MRVADLIAKRLADWGLTTCFTVTGGGAMHLNDAFAANEAISVTYMHHEQACAMAAEGFARVDGLPAIVNVTTGPGVINALNGVFGAFTDSIPMIVVSGQVRRSTMADAYGLSELRQLGDQEVRTSEVIKTMVKESWLLLKPEEAVGVVDAAVLTALSGRPGPTWIDVPVDVQGQEVTEGDLPALPVQTAPLMDFDQVKAVTDLLLEARRPLILAGTGVRLSNTMPALLRLAESANVPVATAWTHDVFPNEHALYAGRPGTIGTRAANFVLQACDLLLVLGSRLNIRQTSYNFEAFAPHATIVWVDVDEAELRKPFVQPSVAIQADLRAFLPSLAENSARSDWPDRENWLAWCQDIRSRFEPRYSDYPERASGINPYHFVMALSDCLPDDAILVCGNASACIIPFQVHRVPQAGRLFSNSGAASMGYDLPAAIGASTADPTRLTVCLAGDGSLMMNLQELQTLVASRLDVLLFVLNNDGYLSIRQTQSNFFARESGSSSNSGISFPRFEDLCQSFGLPTRHLVSGADWQRQLRSAIGMSGPRVVVVELDAMQEFEPRLKSRLIGGRIQTPALDDMFPHLDERTLTEVRTSFLTG